MSITASNAFKQIDIDELCCSICQENYDNASRVPRMLSCGHTFCTSCLKNILRQADYHCPDCRTSIYYDNVESIPICYVVKKIVEAVNEINEKFVNSSNPGRDSGCNSDDTESDDEELPSNGYCKSHKSPRHLFCASCMVWICGTCLFLKHQKKNLNSSQSPCKVVLSRDAVGELKNKEKLKVDKQIQIFAQIESTLAKFVSVMNKRFVGDVYRSKKMKDILQQKGNVGESLDILEDTLDALNRVQSINEWKKVSKYIENLFEVQNYPMEKEDVLKGFFKCFMNSSGQLELKLRFATSFDFIFSKRIGNKKLYSKLDYNWCWKYSTLPKLKESVTPKDDDLVFHLNELFLPSMYTYFELEDEHHESMGIVVFELFDTDRSKLFRMLCTGEAGPSYKNTSFFRNNGVFCRYLMGGDYEHNNGQGGKTLIPINHDYLHDMTEGVVCGHELSQTSRMAQFKIFYCVRGALLNHEAKGVIARIVQGLSIIDRVAEIRWEYVKIKDCGLYFYNSTRYN